MPARSALDCRALTRGAVGDVMDGRSKEARFLRQAEAALLDQLGGDPPFTQRQLVRRAARLMLAAEKLDGHITGGDSFTPNDAASLGGLSGALLDVLRDLGLPSRSSATNSKGHVFVYHRSANTRLFEFDQNGNYVREIGEGSYGFEFAHSVRVDSEDGASGFETRCP